MASRPDTARSEISSAISEDGFAPLPPLSDRAGSTTPGLPSSSHGYAQFRGVTSPINRTFRSPPPPSTTSGTSRPQSPESTTSRTHVPSLTAQGFLRPMSSSRLQQQRLANLRNARSTRNDARPSTGATFRTEDDDTQSVRSNRTGPYVSMPPQHRLTASITTAYTESEAAEHYDEASQPGMSDTGRYFQHSEPEKRSIPAPLDLSKALNVAGLKEKALQSPHSFRSGLSIGSKQIIQSSHEPLRSTAPSPAPRYQEVSEKRFDVAQQSAMGKNYEYFEGNNTFWLGGRIQNARDRPINILTGLFLVVPAILFFVFWLV